MVPSRPVRQTKCSVNVVFFHAELSAIYAPQLVRKDEVESRSSELTTYFEELSCTTLASVTSNSKLSASLLPVGAGLAPLTRRRFLQLS